MLPASGPLAASCRRRTWLRTKCWQLDSTGGREASATPNLLHLRTRALICVAAGLTDVCKGWPCRSIAPCQAPCKGRAGEQPPLPLQSCGFWLPASAWGVLPPPHPSTHIHATTCNVCERGGGGGMPHWQGRAGTSPLPHIRRRRGWVRGVHIFCGGEGGIRGISHALC